MNNSDNSDKKKLIIDEENRVQVAVEFTKPKTTDSRDLTLTRDLMQQGFELDTEYGAIPITPIPELARSLDSRGMDVVIVRGKIDRNKIKDLEAQPNVVKVWEDTAGIRPFKNKDDHFIQMSSVARGSCPIPPCDCDPGTPKGTINDVANYLGIHAIHADGIKGQNIVVAIHDGGTTAEGKSIRSQDTIHTSWPGKLIPNVIDGSVSDWGTTGVDWDWHGNMCATDVLGIAPDAKLYDLRITGDTLTSAYRNFDWAINRHKVDGTPHIITNSWGYYQREWDPNYTINPDHFLTRKVIEAINEGIIVLFAAGNCGGNPCADDRCGSDTGQGRSIWGANGHKQVITVAAVNKNEQYVGYSSCGPAALDPNKPDFASITHFTGFFNSDSGTSAATPIAAGVIALLKQKSQSVTQDEVKNVLMTTAKNKGGSDLKIFLGAGIIQAKAAYDKLSRQTAVITPLPPDEMRNRSEGGNGPLVLNDPRSMLVKNLQIILKKLGHELGNSGPNHDGIDGKYGNKTHTAVLEFQATHNDIHGNKLQADGKVGKLTAEALNKSVRI
ncbi:S8 family serine peptidase [Candidatus Nitrosocosmicus sp. R]